MIVNVFTDGDAHASTFSAEHETKNMDDFQADWQECKDEAMEECPDDWDCTDIVRRMEEEKNWNLDTDVQSCDVFY